MNNKFKKLKKFSLDGLVENSKFDFCKNLKWFLIAPLVIILIGVILLCTVGFNLGIDFTGGSNMTIYIDNDGTFLVEEYDEGTLNIKKDLNKIERKVNEVLNGFDLRVSSVQTTTITDVELGLSEADAVIVKYQNNKGLSTEDITARNEEIRLALLKEFGFAHSDADKVSEVENSGLVMNGGITTASASSELMMKSFIALLVAIVIILVYVVFRFEFTSGMAAILALFHDLLVTASVMLICRVQVNVGFIAALITILGYSINNTIIIFDRMRDEIKLARTADKKIENKVVANSAVRSTMLRSVLTTLTTFIMIFFITVIGVPDIREFAFPIMVGILAGFYSSVFMTPGLWAIAYKPRKKRRFFAASKTAKAGAGSEAGVEGEIEVEDNVDVELNDQQRTFEEDVSNKE